MYKTYRQYVSDFETTVYPGQTYTEVWAAALVEIGSEDVSIYHSIGEWFEGVCRIPGNIRLYFHNLRFDGSFIVPYLIKAGYTHVEAQNGLPKPRELRGKEYMVIISDMGQWYKIVIHQGRRLIEIRDSLKLLPFPVRVIGHAFNTRHQKLEMEYTGYRYAGCEITPEEREYIANDVLVVSEALQFMFEQGHTRLTIGSCCLAEFKAIWGKERYEYMMPNLYDVPLDNTLYGVDNAFDYVHKAYKGGWCYLNPNMVSKPIHGGLTLDVNSLYPSMMSSKSGNVFPVGLPTFWRGEIPIEATLPNKYYFVRFRCRFYLKKGYLPTVQIKTGRFYVAKEWLTTSDIECGGKRSPFYIDNDGNLVEHKVTLTMTMTDFEMFKEHYHVYGLEVLDGCYFDGWHNVFDEYIEKYFKLKQESTGAMRTLAKLFLNSLYGKTSSTRRSDYKVPIVVNGELMGYETIEAYDKEPGYIPIGAAITSYSRRFTIRAAMFNYRYFLYSDTDSIHLSCTPDKVKGVTIHDTDLLCWKLEKVWDYGLFVRQKTYMECVGDDIAIKCAGMPDTCKAVFLQGLKDGLYTREDFKPGLVLPGKLIPKRIQGGTILCDVNYEIR